MGVSDNLAESGSVPAYGLVTAKFVTHQHAPGGETDGVPVQGRVVFTPTARVADAGTKRVFIPAPVPVKGERGEPGPKGDRGGLDAEAAALVQRLASGAAPRDTGWRRVESPAIADGALFYRRVGDWCIIAARGGVWDTITVHDRPDIPDTNYRDVGEKIRLSLTTPAGWQPDQPVLAPVVTDSGESRGIIILHSRGDGNRITWRRGTLDLSPQNRSNLRCGLLIYPATDPFPTALPGTPA